MEYPKIQWHPVAFQSMSIMFSIPMALFGYFWVYPTLRQTHRLRHFTETSCLTASGVALKPMVFSSRWSWGGWTVQRQRATSKTFGSGA